MHYSELPTPALTIDLNILDRNLDRMARYCGQHNVGLRPHTKTHKTTEIARMQLDRGAVGLTVAKTGEAEVMAGAGLDDILLAFPVLGQEAVRRLANLTVGRRLLISLDNRGIYLTPPTTTCSVQGHGRGLSTNLDGVGTTFY